MNKNEASQLSFIPGMVMTDTRFMTAREKKIVLRHWEAFLKHGCQRPQFTQALYHHLIMNCSFIAHYDINGFYDTYFVNGDDTLQFLSQFDREKGCRSIEYGMTFWLTNREYSDINDAMVEVAGSYIPQLLQAAKANQKAADLARAKALLAKHNIQI